VTTAAVAMDTLQSDCYPRDSASRRSSSAKTSFKAAEPAQLPRGVEGARKKPTGPLATPNTVAITSR
jgi:hypothetical protein